MNQIEIAYALTTVDRVQTRIGLGTAVGTPVLAAIIAAVTDRIEGECGGRRFLRTTYTNEIITIFNQNQKYLNVKNTPIESVSSLQYRTGLKSAPNYTDFNNDDWEIVNDGKEGMIRVYGLFADINAVRISYVAGYKIDFTNTGSPTAHTLPADITDLAERLTVKIWKRREREGNSTESFEGNTVTLDKLLNDDDKEILSRYKRLPQFI